MSHASLPKIDSWNVFPAHSTPEFIPFPEFKMGRQPHHTLEPQRFGHVLKWDPASTEQLQYDVVKERSKFFLPNIINQASSLDILTPELG